MNASERLSAGLKALPNKSSSFASTQAAWRFYNNEAVSLQVLQEPLTAAAHEGIVAHCSDYALCMHDWSCLSYKHLNKSDTYAITHEHDVGYDLQTSLIVSDKTGQPIAPVAQRLVSSEGSYATYSEAKPSLPVNDHLDEVSDSIEYLEAQGFAKPLVHAIDREGDSVGHIRRWDAAGCLWLVRVKDNPKVECKDKSVACKAIAQELEFHRTREVIYHGSRVLDADGEVLAEWLLLSNVNGIPAATIALWYYWRWQIESFFKLMKSAGHHLESWQQESASAIAKRLLVASMACVTVWAIAADKRRLS